MGRSTGPVFWLVLATMLLVLLQLVPLPPGLWTALPGREFLLSAPLSQETWRPWSLTPSTTINAASSLIVPVVTLYLVRSMRQAEMTGRAMFSERVGKYV